MNKYIYLYVLQGAYGCGWEDLTASESLKETKQNKKEYQDNERGKYRIISRRDINPLYMNFLFKGAAL
jgi:hypothetical protein